jgi:hypothetical protein
MADLLGNDTDYEMDKYLEANLVTEAGINPAIEKNKKSVFNTETNTHDILMPMSRGGYIKIGEEGETVDPPKSILIEGMEFGPETPEFQRYYPTPQPEAMETAPASLLAPTTESAPVEGAVSFANERMASTGAMPTMEDFDAAGYTPDVVEAAGLMGPQEDLTLSPEEIAQKLASGEPFLVFGEGDPTIREAGTRFVEDLAVRLATEGMRAELLEEQGVSPSVIEEAANIRASVEDETDPSVIQEAEQRARSLIEQDAAQRNAQVNFRTIDETIRAATGSLRSSASVYSNALFGTGETNPLQVGVADFATFGALDIQEGYRMFNQSNQGAPISPLYATTGLALDAASSIASAVGSGDGASGSFQRLMGLGLMTAGLAEATVVGKPIAALMKKGFKVLEPSLIKAGAEAEQRIAQEGSTMFSNPVGPIVDRGLAAAGRLVTPQTPDAAFYVAAREGGEQNASAVNRVSEIAKSRGGSKPKVEDLVQFFEEKHVEIHGRQLDPNVEEDFDLAVTAAAEEVAYQMEQATSGRGWYDADVKKTFETLAQTPGLEALANDETLRVIWSAFAAPTSIGNKVNNNTKAATAAFLQFLKTGKVPVDPPQPGAVTEGIAGAGWGMKQKSVASGMKVIAHLIETKGPEGFADWWLSSHTLKELTDLRKAAGLGGGPSGLSGGKDSLHLGAMILGDKTGRFSLNINGYQGTTKDMWFARSYNRHFGNMRNPDGSITGGPRNQAERRRMEEFTSRLIDKLGGDGLSEQDTQAILWFYEQNLFTDLGVVSRPGSFSEAAEGISSGLRSGVRAGDEAEVANESAGESVLTGFRGISNPKRTVRSQRRGSGLGSEASGPYTREGGTGSEGAGLLSLNPDPLTQRLYQESNISLPKINEVSAVETAATFNLDMTKAMSAHEFAAQVEIKSAEELSNARLFRTENGSGFAIKPDGDIVAVFQSANETGSVGYSMIQAAVEAGGRKLDAFDTFLPGIYEAAGFKPVARLPWNDEFAPPGWNKDTFNDFNNGEPDVVFFVYDPNYFGGATDVPRFTDYDEAVAAQDAELARLGE